MLELNSLVSQSSLSLVQYLSTNWSRSRNRYNEFPSPQQNTLFENQSLSLYMFVFISQASLYIDWPYGRIYSWNWYENLLGGCVITEIATTGPTVISFTLVFSVFHKLYQRFHFSLNRLSLEDVSQHCGCNFWWSGQCCCCLFVEKSRLLYNKWQTGLSLNVNTVHINRF